MARISYEWETEQTTKYWQSLEVQRAKEQQFKYRVTLHRIENKHFIIPPVIEASKTYQHVKNS